MSANCDQERRHEAARRLAEKHNASLCLQGGLQAAPRSGSLGQRGGQKRAGGLPIGRHGQSACSRLFRSIVSTWSVSESSCRRSSNSSISSLRSYRSRTSAVFPCIALSWASCGSSSDIQPRIFDLDSESLLFKVSDIFRGVGHSDLRSRMRDICLRLILAVELVISSRDKLPDH